MHDLIVALGSATLGVFGGIILERYKGNILSRRNFLTTCSNVFAARGVHGGAFNHLANDQMKDEARKVFRRLSGELQVAIDGLPTRERKQRYFAAVDHVRALSHQVGQDDTYGHYEKRWKEIEHCLK